MKVGVLKEYELRIEGETIEAVSPRLKLLQPCFLNGRLVACTTFQPSYELHVAAHPLMSALASWWGVKRKCVQASSYCQRRRRMFLMIF